MQAIPIPKSKTLFGPLDPFYMGRFEGKKTYMLRTDIYFWAFMLQDFLVLKDTEEDVPLVINTWKLPLQIFI